MPAQRDAAKAIPIGEEVATRVFPAPRELVFEVWTKVEHFTRWFGPHGADVESCEIDPRPGGVLRFAHRSGDGTKLHLKGMFREVVQDERLVFTLGFVDEHGRPRRHPMFPDWPRDAVIETTVTFESVEEGTRIRVVQDVSPSDAAAHPSVKRHGELAREGWVQVFERLGEHLSRIATRKEHPT